MSKMLIWIYHKEITMFYHQIEDELSLALSHYHFASKVGQLVGTQKAYLGQWLPWVKFYKEPISDDDKKYNTEQYENFVKSALVRFGENSGLDCLIIYQNEVIGKVSLNTIDHHLKKCEIGYWLHQDYQGHGIMTKAVRAIMDIAKTIYGMQISVIKAAKHNTPSRKVAERLGYTFHGIIPHNELVNGKIYDHAYYSKKLSC